MKKLLAAMPEPRRKRLFWIAGALLLCLVLGAGWFLFGFGSVFASGTAARLELGEKYLLEQNYHQAQIQFAAALESNPQTPEAYLGHGLASYALGEVSGFEEDYNALTQLLPEKVPVLQAWKDAVVNGVLLQDDYFSSSGGTCSLRYTYNLYGQRVAVARDYEDDAQQDSLSRYTYNDQGQLTRLTVYKGEPQSESHHIDYLYDETGNIIQATCTLADGSISYVTSYSYTAGHLLQSIRSTGSNAYTRSYTFDAAGNCVEEVYESGSAAASSTTAYTYQSGATGCGFRLNLYGDLESPLYIVQSRAVRTPTSITQWTCDAQGHCLTQTSDDSYEENTYDSLGRILTNQLTYGTQMENTTSNRYLYGSLSQALDME